MLSGGEAVDVRIPLMPAASVVHVSRYGRHILDDAGIHPRLELEVVGLGVTLITHLCRQIGAFAGGLHQQFGLVEGARQRLLDINMFARSQRQHRNREVRMIGRRNRHGIEEVACLVEEFAEVAEKLGLGIHRHHLLGVFGAHIHITQSHYLDHARLGKFLDNLAAAVTDADVGYLHLFAFGFCILCLLTIKQRGAAHCQTGRSHHHGFQKFAS